MSDSAKKLKQAALLFKQGDKEKAREILLALVSEDEDNEKAWLLLSTVVDTLEDRQIALENALTVNPNNAKAKKGLALVEKKLAQRKPKKQEPLGGHGWSTMDTNETEVSNLGDGWEQYTEEEEDTGFGDTPVESPFDKPANEDPFKFGEMEVIEPDTSSTASSVDWGSSSDSDAFGSGKQVEQPSSEQYDSWVDNLGIGDSSSSASAAASSPTKEEPSGESGWGDIDTDDVFGGRSESNLVTTTDLQPAQPASEPVESSPFGDSDPWGDSDSTETSDAWGTSSEAASPDSDPWGSSSDTSSSVNASADPWGNVQEEIDSNNDPWGSTSTSAEEATSSSSASWGTDSGWDDDPFGDPDSAFSFDSGFDSGGSFDDLAKSASKPKRKDVQPVKPEEAGPAPIVEFGDKNDDPFDGLLDDEDDDFPATEAFGAPSTEQENENETKSFDALSKAAQSTQAPENTIQRAMSAYRLIPKEIPAKQKTYVPVKLLASVAILAILNLGALGLLISQL